MKICVIGSGYVGLVAGACFAGTGNVVTCVDINEAKVKMLQDSIMPIYEPGLEELVRSNQANGRLSFTTDSTQAIQQASVIFIAVGTPPDEDGSADLKHVLAVAEEIGHHMDGYTVVVVKSTVPVGTCDLVHEVIAAQTNQTFDVVSNPEFLKEGAALNDFLHPDRVVVGTPSDRARRIMGELYSPFMRKKNRMIYMDTRSSEMTKYASNAMLATKISFINEIANLCEKVGADVEHVRLGMSADERIGPHFIFPGCGYGGSCFPKDIKALVGTAGQYGAKMQILEAVEQVNAGQKSRLAERVLQEFGPDLSGRTVGVWGLAFKPKTDDMREAPSAVTIHRLLEAGATVRGTDPVAMETAAAEFDGWERLSLVKNEYDAIDGADALIICTEWNQYRNPDFERVKQLLKTPLIVDGRNIFSLDRMARMGFIYYGIGRSVRPTQ
ncbi:MAG: UDP-glucose/GDP-mannose dehydrogenase family protein [Myxococcota bacterium]